ncbi:MAG: hypothetical protein LUH07_00615 [Lachnospiraceae bacterium]|nr:hypothetical protein [Lachnospiraceae bacterium]
MKFDLHATDHFAQLFYNLVYGLVGGLLIAALLISASIICTTDLQPRFLGMPVIATVGYGLAILLAVSLIIHYFHGKKFT